MPRSIASRVCRGSSSTAVRRRWARLRCLAHGARDSGSRRGRGGRGAVEWEVSSHGAAGRMSGAGRRCGCWSPRSATRGTRSRRSRWRGRWPARGHEVVVESWERWREPVEELGLEFEAAEEYTVFPPPAPGSPDGASAARGGAGADAAARGAAAGRGGQRHPHAGAGAGRGGGGGAAGDADPAPLSGARAGDAVLRRRGAAAADAARPGDLARPGCRCWRPGCGGGARS